MEDEAVDHEVTLYMLLNRATQCLKQKRVNFLTIVCFFSSGFYHSRKKALMLLSISHSSLFHTKTSYTRDKFGSETMTVTLHHEIFNKVSYVFVW